METTNFLEKAFIGTIMSDNKLLKDTVIKPEHFASQVHRTIYQKMQRLDVKGHAVDAVTVLMDFEMADIEGIGGANYLTEMQSMADEKSFEKYEKTILDSYRKRKMKNVMVSALEKDWELDEVISKLSELETFRENDRVTGFDIAMRIFELPFREEVQEKAIPTGLQILDNYIGGLQKTELYIMAARPSMGKTALALNLAINTERNGAKVIFFSLEMSSKSIGNRLASHVGGLNLNKFKNPYKFFDQADKDHWHIVTGEISEMDLVVFEKPAQSIAEMRSKIRKEIRESNGKDVVVFIDYLQLIQARDIKATPHIQISQISRDLKQIAREFNIPVVCLSQLNRDVEKRDNKRPMMSDLRDSGSIEQDADVILLLYRDGYYKHREAKEENKQPLMMDILEIDIAKNRQGETKRIEVIYDLSRGKISYDSNRATGVIKDADC